LLADLRCGHRVEQVVYVETGLKELYWDAGVDVPMEPVGETRRVVEMLRASGPVAERTVAAIVGHVNLMLGADVRPVLDAHLEAGAGAFRGIRHATSRDQDVPRYQLALQDADPTSPAFVAGLRELAKAGLVFDAMMWHPQLGDLYEFASAVPELVIAVNHLGGPMKVGRFSRPYSYREQWRASLAEIAQLPNVYMKLSGLGIAEMGLDPRTLSGPLRSDELVQIWGEDVRYVIDLFTPNRCMFASNFPVDRRGFAYGTVWNAYKKVTQNYTSDERDALFHRTADTVYSLPSRR
jgi:predicted TIM-barrel fold metal-dependent hydrolase